MKQGFQPGFEKSGKAENSTTKTANEKQSLGICTTFTPPPIQLGIIRGLTSFILMTLIFTLALSSPIYAQDDSASKTKPSTPIVGDTNADGVVDITDSRNIAADLGGAPSGNHGDTDLNNDGVVDAEDCHILAQAIMDNLAESKSSKSNSSRSSELNSGETMMMDSIGSTVTLINGDAIGDNVIDDFDLNEVNGAFGALGNWPTVPDMNGDGVVDDFELGMVLGNFGSEGTSYEYSEDDTIIADGGYILEFTIDMGTYSSSLANYPIRLLASDDNGVTVYEQTVYLTSSIQTVTMRVPDAGYYDVQAKVVGMNNSNRDSWLTGTKSGIQTTQSSHCGPNNLPIYPGVPLNNNITICAGKKQYLSLSPSDTDDTNVDDSTQCTWSGPVMNVDGCTAMFYTQTPGTYTVSCKVTDGGSPCNDNDVTVYYKYTVLDNTPVIELIEPTGNTVTGIVKVKLKITSTECGYHHFLGCGEQFPNDTKSIRLDVSELASHPECALSAYPLNCPIVVSSENNGLVYITYVEWYWETNKWPEVPLSHNGAHKLIFTINYPVYSYDQQEFPPTNQVIFEKDINVDNMVITAVNPPDVVVIKEGEPAPDITVSASHASGPVTAKLSIVSVARHYETVRIFSKDIGVNEPIVFTDADYNKDTNNNPLLQPGMYTYDVTLLKSIQNYGVTTTDEATYRSQYTSIERATQDGQPVMEAEYAGYDDNNTPDNEADDNYLYYIRYYKLDDILSKDAHAGVVKLYNPDREVVEEWNVAGQECLADGHSSNDGLKVIQTFGEGVDPTHKLLLKVPIADMETAGDYRFVLSVTDDHPYCYRDHQPRPVLEMNSNYVVWMGLIDRIEFYPNADYQCHAQIQCNSNTVTYNNQLLWDWLDISSCHGYADSFLNTLNNEWAILRQQPGGDNLYIMTHVISLTPPPTGTVMYAKVNTSRSDPTGTNIKLVYTGTCPYLVNRYHFHAEWGKELKCAENTVSGISIKAHDRNINDNEIAVFDHAENTPSSYKDSDALITSSGYLLNGKAHFTNFNIATPTLPTLIRYAKAAGVEKITAKALTIPGVKLSSYYYDYTLPIKRQAKILYYSGHSQATFNTSGPISLRCRDGILSNMWNALDVVPKVNWVYGLEYFIIGACSALIPNEYNGFRWGNECLKGGPLKGLCGYWYKSPRDDSGWFGLGDGDATRIARLFGEYINTKVPASHTGDRILDAWLESCYQYTAPGIVYNSTSYWLVDINYIRNEKQEIVNKINLGIKGPTSW